MDLRESEGRGIEGIQTFPGGASIKELACQCRRYRRLYLGSIPGSGRSPAEGMVTYPMILA